jgi:hypothetical protein
MKRSFFGPILFLGIMMLISGFCGMLTVMHNMNVRDRSDADFIEHYKGGTNYEALFNEAVNIRREASFLQSEYMAFPAAGSTLGLFIIAFAFDRRKMFKKIQELQQQLEDHVLRNTPKAD